MIKKYKRIFIYRMNKQLMQLAYWK